MLKNCKKTQWLTLEEPVREDIGNLLREKSTFLSNLLDVAQIYLQFWRLPLHRSTSSCWSLSSLQIELLDLSLDSSSCSIRCGDVLTCYIDLLPIFHYHIDLLLLPVAQVLCATLLTRSSRHYFVSLLPDNGNNKFSFRPKIHNLRRFCTSALWLSSQTTFFCFCLFWASSYIHFSSQIQFDLIHPGVWLCFKSLPKRQCAHWGTRIVHLHSN